MLSPFGGAVQRRILELSKEQARRGHDVSRLGWGRWTVSSVWGSLGKVRPLHLACR